MNDKIDLVEIEKFYNEHELSGITVGIDIRISQLNYFYRKIVVFLMRKLF